MQSLINKRLHIFESGLWLPPNLDEELSEEIKLWQEQPGLNSESVVANRLSKLSHMFIASADSACGFNRAATAIENNDGTCIAHSEVTIAFAALHGLKTFAVWDTAGATVLWPGQFCSWRIDPYFKEVEEFYEDQPTMSDSLTLLASYLLSTEQGAYIKKMPKAHKIEASFITGSLLDNPCPYLGTGQYIETLLTPDQAIDMLNASIQE